MKIFYELLQFIEFQMIYRKKRNDEMKHTKLNQTYETAVHVK